MEIVGHESAHDYAFYAPVVLEHSIPVHLSLDSKCDVGVKRIQFLTFGLWDQKNLKIFSKNI